MSSEYIRISSNEKVFAQKRLLLSQMEIINSTKHLQEYARLRKEELVIQIALKNKSQEALDSIKLLEKLLPHSRFKLPQAEKDKKENNFPDQNQFEPKEDKVDSLEEELNEIRMKLQKLNSSF